MKIWLISCSFCIFLASLPFSSAANTSYIHEYTDTAPNANQKNLPQDYIQYKNRLKASFIIKGGIDTEYKKISKNIHIPGYMSTTRINPIAEIIGPNNNDHIQLQIGETAYLRWQSATAPKEGELFSVYTALAVLQNKGDATDFIIRREKAEGDQYQDGYRLSGFLYESKGLIRIGKEKEGIVRGLVENKYSGFTVGDFLMPVLPSLEKVDPMLGTSPTSAAIVSGSPYNRISSNQLTYIYINRGSRDGIKLGQIFSSVENISLTTEKSGLERSLGEAMVVHVSDAYSTAIITRQFDLIRIGALLKAKVEGDSIFPKHGFTEQNESAENTPIPPPTAATATTKELKEEPINQLAQETPLELNPIEDEPIVPTPTPPKITKKIEAPTYIETPKAQTIPENKKDPLDDLEEIKETKNPSPAPPIAVDSSANEALSDLDKLELNQKADGLSSEEKSRLEKIANQEKSGPNGELVETDSNLSSTKKNDTNQKATLENTKLQNAFADPENEEKKPLAKKDLRKRSTKKKVSDEEELNLLMMQN